MRVRRRDHLLGRVILRALDDEVAVLIVERGLPAELLLELVDEIGLVDRLLGLAHGVLLQMQRGFRCGKPFSQNATARSIKKMRGLDE